jgi:hypothetical protein
VDLLLVTRKGIYFPAAEFSNSIKSVGPALCPDFTYDDLTDIADGMAASAAFLVLASGSLTDPEEIKSNGYGKLCRRIASAIRSQWSRSIVP